MQNDDKELLVLAAKAAGYKVTEGEYITLISAPGGPEWKPNWNPLIDDGDALRLLAKLELYVDVCPYDQGRRQMGRTIVAGKVPPAIHEDHCGNPVAATRRAIVRAAAEIGKGMK